MQKTHTYFEMKSIRELYRIGTGPSSSHTMGPRKAAEQDDFEEVGGGSIDEVFE